MRWSKRPKIESFFFLLPLTMKLPFISLIWLMYVWNNVGTINWNFILFCWIVLKKKKKEASLTHNLSSTERQKSGGGKLCVHKPTCKERVRTAGTDLWSVSRCRHGTGAKMSLHSRYIYSCGSVPKHREWCSEKCSLHSEGPSFLIITLLQKLDLHKKFNFLSEANSMLFLGKN